VTTRERLVMVGQWLGLGALVGALCGAASAGFLWLLGHATAAREGAAVIVFALPVAGLLIGWGYERLGASIKGGNNLVIDTLHSGGAQLPLRHGADGAGGHRAHAPLRRQRRARGHRGPDGREPGRRGLASAPAGRLLAPASAGGGVAGGFGSVFGTPWRGTVFALEVVVLGRLEYAALVPALVAALVGDLTSRARSGWRTLTIRWRRALELTPLVLAKWVVFAAAVAAVTWLFIELVQRLKALGERRRAAPAAADGAGRRGGGGAVAAGRHRRLPRPRRAGDRAGLRGRARWRPRRSPGSWCSPRSRWARASWVAR
jgi:H+/Cl- antiporter ClcA